MAGLPLAPELGVTELLESERARVAAAAREITRAHGLGEKSVRVLQGSAVEVLPRVAAEDQVDLVVMGAVSRSRLREVFIGSTAERVLDRLPCDVLVIRSADYLEKLPF
jgi:universal stress protein E